MSTKMAASHTENKVLNDVIFAASGAAQAAIKEHGAVKVTNATLGAIFDEEEKIACLPTVEKVFRNLPMNEVISYAPVAGLPSYLDSVKEIVFAGHRPAGYVEAVATSGGTGAVHHAIENYSEVGDAVLTSDWFWGPYNALCQNIGRRLETYPLFDDALCFNAEAFARKVDDLLQRQESLLVIINTPAHNPTGYSLSDEDWDAVLAAVREQAKAGKRISILVDIAYIEYSGTKEETRGFMEKFADLPENIFVMFAFSMSKAYTFYGQRTGAIVGLSASRAVMDEFADINKFSSRATWSNINRGAMALLATIQQDAALLAQYEKEREALYQIVRSRGALFMQEADACGLKALPYKAGFFLAVPAKDPKAVAEKLHEDLVFAVPLKRGVRIAVCGVATPKIKGLAAKVKKAWDAVEK